MALLHLHIFAVMVLRSTCNFSMVTSFVNILFQVNSLPLMLYLFLSFCTFFYGCIVISFIVILHSKVSRFMLSFYDVTPFHLHFC